VQIHILVTASTRFDVYSHDHQAAANYDLRTKGHLNAYNHLMCFEEFTVRLGSLLMVAIHTEWCPSSN